jgi:hypothetical protein
MTYGEMFPRIRTLPGYEALAATAYPGPPSAFEPAHHESLKLLVLGCDYRGGPAVECGCTRTRICLMGKGRPIPGSDSTDVTNQDCLDCVSV